MADFLTIAHAVVDGRLAMQERCHFFNQGFMFEIGEFTSIKIHAVLGASFITNVGLICIFDVIHGLAASRTRAICDGIVGFAGLGIPCIEKLRHPFVFKLLSFA